MCVDLIKLSKQESSRRASEGPMTSAGRLGSGESEDERITNSHGACSLGLALTKIPLKFKFVTCRLLDAIPQAAGDACGCVIRDFLRELQVRIIPSIAQRLFEFGIGLPCSHHHKY